MNSRSTGSDAPDYREVFRRNLAKFRRENALSQLELSRKCYFHPSYVGKIERGQKNPSFESILRVCDCLSISPVDLFSNPSEDSSLKIPTLLEFFEAVEEGVLVLNSEGECTGYNTSFLEVLGAFGAEVEPPRIGERWSLEGVLEPSECANGETDAPRNRCLLQQFSASDGKSGLFLRKIHEIPTRERTYRVHRYKILYVPEQPGVTFPPVTASPKERSPTPGNGTKSGGERNSFHGITTLFLKVECSSKRSELRTPSASDRMIGVMSWLRNNLRDTDTVVRIDADLLCLILPTATPSQARELIDRLKLKRTPGANTAAGKCRMLVGMDTIPEKNVSTDSLTDRARNLLTDNGADPTRITVSFADPPSPHDPPAPTERYRG